MSLDLKDIIDFETLNRRFEAFRSATGTAVAIVAPDGTICTDGGLRKMCARFYLRHPESSLACLHDEARLKATLTKGKQARVHHCPHGLFIVTAPIIVGHAHAANLHTGPFVFEPPDAQDRALFENQAEKWQFDRAAFTAAAAEVPAISREKATAIRRYLERLAEMIAEMGVNRLRLEKSEKQVLKAEAALKEEIRRRRDNAQQLGQILEASPIPTYVIDGASRITHWNPACAKLTGIPAAEMIGTDRHQAIFFPHRRPLMADLIVKKAGTSTLSTLYGESFRKSQLIKDGYEGEVFLPEMGKSGKWLFVTAAPIKNARGDVIGAIETIQDITMKRETEQNLRASENLYRQLFDAANDGIFILKDGIVVDCNQKAMELFKATREESIGQATVNFSPKIQPDGRSSVDELQRRRTLVRQGVRQFFDWRFFRKDGVPFDAEVSVTQIIINDVPHTLAIVRDITERKKMIVALQEREKELDEKSRYLEKVNQALKASLDHREIEKRAVEENMLVNLKRFVFPHIEALASCKINPDARAYLNIIETNLNDMVSQFSTTVFGKYLDLTPTEVRIADLIRNGKNSKAIAQMLGLSPSSVQWHRKNIREKLGLTNKKVNLQTYLASLTEAPLPIDP